MTGEVNQYWLFAGMLACKHSSIRGRKTVGREASCQGCRQVRRQSVLKNGLYVAIPAIRPDQKPAFAIAVKNTLLPAGFRSS
jgi:hypothetical protein